MNGFVSAGYKASTYKMIIHIVHYFYITFTKGTFATIAE